MSDFIKTANDAFATLVGGMLEMGAAFQKMALKNDDGSVKAAVLVMASKSPEAQEQFGRICRHFDAVSNEEADPPDLIAIGREAVEMWMEVLGDGVRDGYSKRAEALIGSAIKAGLVEPNKPCEACGHYDTGDGCECWD